MNTAFLRIGSVAIFLVCGRNKRRYCILSCQKVTRYADDMAYIQKASRIDDGNAESEVVFETGLIGVCTYIRI